MYLSALLCPGNLTALPLSFIQYEFGSGFCLSGDFPVTMIQRCSDKPSAIIFRSSFVSDLFYLFFHISAPNRLSPHGCSIKPELLSISSNLSISSHLAQLLTMPRFISLLITLLLPNLIHAFTTTNTASALACTPSTLCPSDDSGCKIQASQSKCATPTNIGASVSEFNFEHMLNGCLGFKGMDWFESLTIGFGGGCKGFGGVYVTLYGTYFIYLIHSNLSSAETNVSRCIFRRTQLPRQHARHARPRRPLLGLDDQHRSCAAGHQWTRAGEVQNSACELGQSHFSFCSFCSCRVEV